MAPGGRPKPVAAKDCGDARRPHWGLYPAVPDPRSGPALFGKVRRRDVSEASSTSTSARPDGWAPASDARCGPRRRPSPSMSIPGRVKLCPRPAGPTLGPTSRPPLSVPKHPEARIEWLDNRVSGPFRCCSSVSTESVGSQRRSGDDRHGLATTRWRSSAGVRIFHTAYRPARADEHGN